MAIKTIEDDIIARLKNVIPELQVEAFPDKPDEYKLIHPLGAILVAYSGSDYSRPEGMGYVLQTVNLEFNVTIIVRNLRDTNGAYEYIDTIIDTLTGYTPTDCDRMYPIQVSFLQESNRLWQYGLVFTVPAENYKP